MLLISKPCSATVLGKMDVIKRVHICLHALRLVEFMYLVPCATGYLCNFNNGEVDFCPLSVPVLVLYCFFLFLTWGQKVTVVTASCHKCQRQCHTWWQGDRNTRAKGEWVCVNTQWQINKDGFGQNEQDRYVSCWFSTYFRPESGVLSSGTKACWATCVADVWWKWKSYSGVIN